MAVELSIRICSSVMFDPLPDAVAVFAYGLIPVTLLLNVGLLRSAEIPTNRLRVLHGAAYAATIISIVVAALYTFSFLVLMPLSLIAILGMGIGFCAWSPLINLIVLCRQLQALKERRRQEEIALPSLSNAVTVCVSALLMIQMVAAPLVIGRAVMEAMYEPAKRASAVTRLRFLHAEDALLTNAGVRNPSFWFQAGAGQFTSIWDSFDDETYRKEPKGAIDAKAVYYLVTGRSASTAPPPSGRRAALGNAAEDAAWEQDMAVEETGGTKVGHPARGLLLASSELNGTLTPDRESAACDWIMEFRNTGDQPQEARADILLPEGGVIDRASLWINGVERSAAFGSTGAVREAYQKVAVVERRDPLLVTSVAPGRVLAQCFPVPAHGAMKIRLGMTAPLQWRDPAAPALAFTPPILEDANFRIDRSLRHSMHLEGKWSQGSGRLSGASQWQIEDRGDLHTASLLLNAKETRTPPALTISGGPAPQAGDKIGSDRVRRVSPFAPPAHPVNLVVLIDPTVRVGEALGAQPQRELRAALAALPAGSRYLIANSRHPERGSTGWESAGAPIPGDDSWWSDLHYVGGLDSMGALEWACAAAKARTSPSAVLWLHDAKPDSVCDVDTLKTAKDSPIHHTILVGVRCGAGEDAVMEAIANDRGVYALSATTSHVMENAVRLAAYAATAPSDTAEIPLGGREPAVNGLYLPPNVSGGDSVSAASRVLATWRHAASTHNERLAASKLAVESHIVTPLSGAVVLETKGQYQEAGLKAPAPAAVPEPSGVAALLLGALLLFWQVRRRRPA
jgi:hypothetical protein